MTPQNLGIQMIARTMKLASPWSDALQYVGKLMGKKPILGERMAEAAREGGVHYRRLNAGDGPGGYEDTLMSLMRRVTGMKEQPVPVSGVHVNFTNQSGKFRSPSGATGFQPADFTNDKLEEAKLFGGFIPHSVGLQDILKRLGRQRTGQTLVQRLRDDPNFGGKFIIKERDGAASAPGSMLSDQTPLSRLSRFLREKSPKNYMVQQRQDLAPSPWWQRTGDAILSKITPSQFADEVKSTSRGTNEYRVHALNGQIIPGATVNRGSATGSLFDLLSPFRSGKVRAAEDHAQEALRALGGKSKNRMFGFDIGFTRDGKPFVIEANPTNVIGSSGSMHDEVGIPFRDAMTSAITGSVGNWQATKALGAGGAGLAGLAGLGSHFSGGAPKQPE